jgi:PAS domain S-box-containing protein
MEGTANPQDVPRILFRLLHEIRVHQIELELQNEELRSASAQLEESRAKYLDLYDFAPVGYLSLNDKGLILEASLTASRLLGLDRSSLINTPFSAYVSMSDYGPFRLHLDKLFKSNEPQTCEVELRPAGGGNLHALLDSIFVRDVHGKGSCRTSVIDITERKRMEEELRASETKYRVVADNTYDWEYWVDDTGRFRYISPSCQRITGYSVSEFEKDPQLFLNMVHPDDRAHLETHVKQVRATSVPCELEFRIIHRDRETRWIGHACQPVFDAQGRYLGHRASNRDITERRQAGEELRQSQERLSLALESSRAGTWDRNMVEDQSTWDDYHHLLFGLTPGTYSGNQRDFFSMVHPDDRERVKHEMAAAIDGDAEYSTTYRVVWPDSSVHFLADRGKVYRDSTGRAVRMIGITWDIAELKQAVEALKESQQQLADIIDFLPDATLVIDREGNVIAWNRAIEEMTGVRAADMLGKGNYEYALPFYGERRPILIDLVLEPQEEIETSYTIIKRKKTVLVGEACVPALRGSQAYLLGTASILRDSQGKVIGAIESIRDITERKRVEEALARAEGKYRGIFENALEGIYQSTVEGRYISCNPALARILGYDSPEELLDTITDIAQQLYVNPEQRAELLRLIDERGAAERFEVQFYRKDKTVAWVVLNVRGVRDESGKLTYLEGIAQDVTESRAFEAQLRQAQKTEAIGTLAGGIAHDFNNILGIIMGYAEIAELSVTEDSKAKHSIDEVLRATHRAKDLVKQILTFSRKTEQERKPLQTTPIVKEAIKLLRASLPTTIEIRQEIELSGGNDLALADPTQIHQVLMNLATNAAHAMREKGGVLRVALSSVHFDSLDVGKPMDLSPGGYLNLTVEDTGPGMDRTIIDRIFDPYFTTKGPGEGTGLGLAVVAGIVKSHGGAITVNSEPGKGTAFHVYFPRLEGGETSEKEVLAPIPRGNERILLVDDEEALVNAMKRMLEHLGYKVTATSSSAEALSLFHQRAEHFDLMITDYTMPKMTGTDLAREIIQIRPDIPIILCTGFNERISEESIRETGISGLLMKPVSLRAVAELIRNVLKTRDDQSQCEPDTTPPDKPDHQCMGSRP